jgi:thioredoxin reductase
MSPTNTDILIVGAGPAGLAAAITLKRLGHTSVTVVDREPEAGGVPRLSDHPGFGILDLHRVFSGPAYARHYVRAAERAGLDLRTSTTITRWAGPTRLAYTSPAGLGEIEAQVVLLATGCRERPRSARLVPGFRPAGVFTTGSLQRFVFEQHLPVGRRAVVVGAEIVSLSAIMTLAHARVEVARMVTDQDQHQVYLPYLPMKWLLMDLLRRIPLSRRTTLTRLLGHKRVEAVELTHLDTGATEIVDCDSVIFTGDWIPEHDLARAGNLALDPGTLGPQADAAYRTSAPGVFAAGNLLHGAETAEVSALEGRHAAQHIAAFLRGTAWPARRLPIQVAAPIDWIYPNTVSATAGALPFGHFKFRPHAFARSVRLGVYQGDTCLHQQTYGLLRPNTSQPLAASWLPRVDLAGPPLRFMPVP